MKAMIDMLGRRFGRLVVLQHTGWNRHGNGREAVWLCRCDCGTVKDFRGYGLRSGNTQSCGCLQRERTGNRARKHGMKSTPEYYSWCAMKQRCYNPNSTDYRNYGARGITVCEAWRHNFSAFLNAVGRRPKPSMTIDRINNNGNYEPGNVRWANAITQHKNRRPSTVACPNCRHRFVPHPRHLRSFDQ